MPSTQASQSPSSDEGYDCMDCGACCRCFPIFASESDAMHEPKIKEEAIRVEDYLRKDLLAFHLYPLPFLDTCPFLKEDKLCRIYETRPEVCRKFEPGSDQCIEARRRLGIK